MLFLFLLLPAALLIMLGALERYERMIDAPARSQRHRTAGADDDVVVTHALPLTTTVDVAGEVA